MTSMLFLLMQPRAFYALELACNGQKNILPRASTCNGNSGSFHDLIFVEDSELKGIVCIII